MHYWRDAGGKHDFGCGEPGAAHFPLTHMSSGAQPKAQSALTPAACVGLQVPALSLFSTQVAPASQ